MATRWVQRRFSSRGVQGNVASAQSPVANTLLWHTMIPRATILADKIAQQTVNLTSGTVTLGLPAGYSNANRLCVFIKTTGKVKVTFTSPVNGAQATIVQGSSAVPGIYCISERVTSIVLKYLSVTATVEYFAFQLPDLTVSTNYKGVTG